MSVTSYTITFGPDPTYTPVRAFAAEGARIGIVTCLQCGATITLDPGDAVPATEIHDRWHEAQR